MYHLLFGMPNFQGGQRVDKAKNKELKRFMFYNQLIFKCFYKPLFLYTF